MKPHTPLLLLLAVTACRQTSVEKQLTANATVSGMGRDCQQPLLTFDTQQKEVEQLAGPAPDGHYYALSLDKPLQTAGTRLTVTLRGANAGELPVCTAMGPAYPTVVILKAEVK